MLLIKQLFKKILPFRYISLIAMYIVGAGLVQYVQNLRHWFVFFQGLFFLIFVSLSIDLITLLIQINTQSGQFNALPIEDRKQNRLSLAIISAALLTVASVILVDWIVKEILWQGLFFLIFTYGFTGLFTIIVKLNKRIKNYQILFETIIFVIIPPAFAYFLQSDDPHRLLTMVVLSLIPAFIAYRLLSQLIAFNRNPNSGNHELIQAIGWEHSMVIHNALILCTFLLFALVTLFGYPWFLIWPVFLALPIGLLEIWLMERVRRGEKPIWKIMQVSTACIYFLPMYLIGFAFWIR